jgi:predicted dehydrogenase
MAEDDYGLSPAKARREIPPPDVDYLPHGPRHPERHGIAVVGAGGISAFHLKAYAAAGWNVVGIADRTLAKAEALRDTWFPGATATTDAEALIRREDVTVVDLTPHPEDRVPLVRAALAAGKHVLSQKPFVLDLALGRQLAAEAEARGLRLAVNHNGRWAPHFRYLLQAVRAGWIGEVRTVDCTLQWDQTWIAGNAAFESIRHLVLFDFGIHWFDFVACLMAPREPDGVLASVTSFPGQRFTPPGLASVIVEYPGAQARLAFNAHCVRGEEDVTTVVGSRGTLRSRGPGLNDQPEMEIYLEDGEVRVPLRGNWFENGFAGTMGELLRAIEEDREPEHAARTALPGLELCFRAMAAADARERPVTSDLRS